MHEHQILLIGRKGTSTNILYHALSARYAVRLVHEDPPPRWKVLRWRAGRLGWPRALGQLLFQLLIMAPMHAASAKRRSAIIRDAGLSAAPPTTTVFRTPSVNNPAFLARLQEWAPSVVVINGTRILTARTLRAIGVPVLNVHAGITPKYRGVHGAYWALVQNDPGHCGVTVHLVDEGVDTGGILGQDLIRPLVGDNFTTYPLLQTAVGSNLLVKAVEELMTGNIQTTIGPKESMRWFHPTLWEYVWHWVTGRFDAARHTTP